LSQLELTQLKRLQSRFGFQVHSSYMRTNVLHVSETKGSGMSNDEQHSLVQVSPRLELST